MRWAIRSLPPATLTLAGRTISIGHSPNKTILRNPLFFNLADNVHPGTVLNGLEANLFIRAVNLALRNEHSAIQRPGKILINAGIFSGDHQPQASLLRHQPLCNGFPRAVDARARCAGAWSQVVVRRRRQ